MSLAPRFTEDSIFIPVNSLLWRKEKKKSLWKIEKKIFDL
jgi:hypothetical protein